MFYFSHVNCAFFYFFSVVIYTKIPFQTYSSCLFKATALRRYLFLFLIISTFPSTVFVASEHSKMRPLSRMRRAFLQPPNCGAFDGMRNGGETSIFTIAVRAVPGLARRVCISIGHFKLFAILSFVENSDNNVLLIFEGDQSMTQQQQLLRPSDGRQTQVV